MSVDGATVGEIGTGWLVLLGVARDDGEDDAAWLADKLLNLRAFEDDQGKMNQSVLDVRAPFSWSASSHCWPTAGQAAAPVLLPPPSRPLPSGSMSGLLTC